MTTVATVSVRLDLISKDFEKGLDVAKDKVKQFSADIEKAGRTLRNVGAGMTAAFTVPMVAMGVKAAMTAGRVDELDLVVRTLGKTAGYSETEIDGYVKAVQEMGIEAGASREVVAKFVTAQLNAADASKIARIAQDQAVITGENSTQTTMRLTDAIIKGSQESFRSMMMNINLSQSYEDLAKEMGVHVDELTEAERVQARVNAVVAYGATVQGTYEASMESGTKQLRSYKRYIDDIFVALGVHFTPALNDVVFAGKDFLQWLKDAVSEGGALEPVIKVVAFAVEELAGKFKDLVTWITEAPDWVITLAGAFGTYLAVLGPVLMVGGQFLIMLPKIKAGLSGIAMTAGISAGALFVLAAAFAAVVVAMVIQAKARKEIIENHRSEMEAVIHTSKSYEEYQKQVRESNKEVEKMSTTTGGYLTNLAKNGLYTETLTHEQWEQTRSLERLGNLYEWLGRNIGGANSVINLATENFEDFNGAASDGVVVMSLAERQAQLAAEAMDAYNASMDELGQAMSGRLGKDQEAFIEKQNSISTALAETMEKIAELEGKSYLTSKQKEELEGLYGEYANLEQAFSDNADAHDEATKRIIFNIMQQQAAAAGFANDSFFWDIAEQWGLIDEATLEVMRTSQEFFDAMQNETAITAEMLAILGLTIDDLPEDKKFLYTMTKDDKWGLQHWNSPGNTTATHTQIFKLVHDANTTYSWDFPQVPDGEGAMGGHMRAGETWLVGERGPELFRPDVSGDIIPNNEIGGNVTNNYYLTMPTTADPTDVGMAFELLEAYGGN